MLNLCITDGCHEYDMTGHVAPRVGDSINVGLIRHAQVKRIVWDIGKNGKAFEIDKSIVRVECYYPSPEEERA